MLAEAEHGLTAMAMAGSQGRYAGDDALLVRFFPHPYLNTTKSAKEGRPVYQETDYIQIMTPGNKDHIVIRPATEMDKQRFAVHYQKYLARQTDEEHMEGTPLSEWPGVTRSQCEELRFLNVLTVEQLAAISDTNAQNIMGVSMLRNRAQEYLKAADKLAVQNQLEDANARMAEMEVQMAEMAEKLEKKPAKKAAKE